MDDQMAYIYDYYKYVCLSSLYVCTASYLLCKTNVAVSLCGIVDLHITVTMLYIRTGFLCRSKNHE